MCRKQVQVHVPPRAGVSLASTVGGLSRCVGEGLVCCVHFYFPTKPDGVSTAERVHPEAQNGWTQSRLLPSRISSPAASTRHSLPARAQPAGSQVACWWAQPAGGPRPCQDHLAPGPRSCVKAGGSESERGALVLAPSGPARQAALKVFIRRAWHHPDRLPVPMWRQPQPLSLLD